MLFRERRLSSIIKSRLEDRGQEFLYQESIRSHPGPSEYKRHLQTHLQTHIDRWSSNSKPDKLSWKPPEDITQDLFKIFEKYRLGERAMICLWINGQLNTAIREPSRISELQDGGLTE